MDKNQVYEIIKDWWNDSMRKDWRTALSDPPTRYNRFEELADKLSRHLSEATRPDEACTCSEGVENYHPYCPIHGVHGSEKSGE